MLLKVQTVAALGGMAVIGKKQEGELLMFWVLVFSFKIQQAIHLYIQKKCMFVNKNILKKTYHMK